ncbi:MAG: PKD domain-containing protein, partial [Flavobacteriales bacterium]|nr:PKD domain-containing protein [Flavobacteriales bacterium]
DIATLLKNNKVLTFEDTELNISFKLTEDTVYSFTMYDTVTTNRFLLHVNTPLVTEQNNVTCYGAANGSLAANGYVNDAKNYVWKDEFNNVVATSVNKLGADTVKNLIQGIYTVEVTNNVTSESVMNTFEITEPQDISSSFLTLTNNENEEITSSATVDTVNVIKGVEVFFENNSENTTIFNWNFGDLTNSSLENPGHIYFNTGVYKVELTSSNGSCSKKSEQYVNVENTLSIDDVENNLDFQLVNISNGFDLILNNDNVSDLSIVINNSLGQEMLSKNLRVDSNYRERFQLEDAQGIYYVTLKSSNTSVTKKIVLTKN